jgi:hypothetical protein
MMISRLPLLFATLTLVPIHAEPAPGRPPNIVLIHATALIGKWHLGLGASRPTDYNVEIKPGPLEVGFSEALFIPATGDRVPCVFVENHRVRNLDPADPIRISYKQKIGNGPTGRENPDLVKFAGNPPQRDSRRFRPAMTHFTPFSA